VKQLPHQAETVDKILVIEFFSYIVYVALILKSCILKLSYLLLSVWLGCLWERVVAAMMSEMLGIVLIGICETNATDVVIIVPMTVFAAAITIGMAKAQRILSLLRDILLIWCWVW